MIIQAGAGSQGRLVFPLTGRTCWTIIRDKPGESDASFTADDDMSRLPHCGLILSESDFIFLPSGGYQSLSLTRTALYLIVEFDYQMLQVPAGEADISRYNGLASLQECLQACSYFRNRCVSSVAGYRQVIPADPD